MEDDDREAVRSITELGIGEGLPLAGGGLACVEPPVGEMVDLSLADEDALIAGGSDFDAVSRPCSLDECVGGGGGDEGPRVSPA